MSNIERPRKNPLDNIKNQSDYNRMIESYSTSSAPKEKIEDAINNLNNKFPKFNPLHNHDEIVSQINDQAAELPTMD